jgi:hypothetical protein
VQLSTVFVSRSCANVLWTIGNTLPNTMNAAAPAAIAATIKVIL